MNCNGFFNSDSLKDMELNYRYMLVVLMKHSGYVCLILILFKGNLPDNVATINYRIQSV
jgi:hypothetical protein